MPIVSAKIARNESRVMVACLLRPERATRGPAAARETRCIRPEFACRPTRPRHSCGYGDLSERNWRDQFAAFGALEGVARAAAGHRATPSNIYGDQGDRRFVIVASLTRPCGADRKSGGRRAGSAR